MAWQTLLSCTSFIDPATHFRLAHLIKVIVSSHLFLSLLLTHTSFSITRLEVATCAGRRASRAFDLAEHSALFHSLLCFQESNLYQNTIMVKRKADTDTNVRGRPLKKRTTTTAGRGADVEGGNTMNVRTDNARTDNGINVSLRQS